MFTIRNVFSLQFSVTVFCRENMFSGKQQCFVYKSNVKIFTWARWRLFCYCLQYYL